MEKTAPLDIYQQEDGFYVGRKLKNGNFGRTVYKLTGDDIMTMFTKFFNDYCEESGQKQMLMQSGDGQLFVAIKVPAKGAGL